MYLKKSNKRDSNKSINQIIKWYMTFDFYGYLSANEVKGKTLDELVEICKASKKFHISLTRKIVSMIEGHSWQVSLMDLNKQISEYSKRI